MKNYSKKLLTLLILLVSVAMFSMFPATAVGSCEPQIQITSEDSAQIEAKYKKTSSNKITFNGNGGKIGSKKSVATNIKKGTKIKKFPTTPKRIGYSFKGWYTKKTGGTKVTKNTKPKKSVTYYAQWNKKLSSEEKKLVGTYGYTSLASGFLSTWADSMYDYQQWKGPAGTFSTIKFKGDGTFEQISLYISQDRIYTCTGNWKISQKGSYIVTNYAEEVRTSSGEKWHNKYPPNENHGMPYTFTTQDGKQGIIIGVTKFYEKIKS